MNEVTETDAGAVEEAIIQPSQELAIATGGTDIAAPILNDPNISMAMRIAYATIELSKRDGAIDKETLKELRSMAKELRDEERESAFAAALSAAQAEIPQVSRLGTVDLGPGKGKYAFSRLEDIDTVLRPIMKKYDFSITFDRKQREGGGLVVIGTLLHKGAAFRTAEFPVPLDSGPGRSNIQAAGSSDTYAKRYIIEGFFNIVRKGKDNDGNTAEPLLEDEIADIMELISKTRTPIVGFLKTMVSGLNWDGDPDDPDYRPDPVMLLEQVQRVNFDRMHQVLAQKLHRQQKTKGGGDDA